MLTEASVEQFAVDSLLSEGFKEGEASEVATDRSAQGAYSPLIERRLHSAVARLNQTIRGDVVADTIRSLRSLPFVSLHENNRYLHDLLTTGVPV